MSDAADSPVQMLRFDNVRPLECSMVELLSGRVVVQPFEAGASAFMTALLDVAEAAMLASHQLDRNRSIARWQWINAQQLIS